MSSMLTWLWLCSWRRRASRAERATSLAPPFLFLEVLVRGPVVIFRRALSVNYGSFDFRLAGVRTRHLPCCGRFGGLPLRGPCADGSESDPTSESEDGGPSGGSAADSESESDDEQDRSKLQCSTSVSFYAEIRIARKCEEICNVHKCAVCDFRTYTFETHCGSILHSSS